VAEAVSRRLFVGAVVGGAGIAVGAGAAYGATRMADSDGDTLDPAGQIVPFHGAHQAGITTPAQDRLAFASFDVSGNRTELRTMLAAWTAAAARMTAGRPVGDDLERELYPPLDTGEALGLAPGHLTITVGFGPTLFDDRFGLASKRPAALIDTPTFPGDQLEANRSGGDLCIQACSDDPQVAFHAIRNLARLGRGVVTMRWSQLGFGRTSSTSSAQATPRNLMGFLDGTNNITAEDTEYLQQYVWVGDDTDQPWMRGGSYVVTRRIRMLIEAWDRDYLADQENIIGRRKISGVPFGGTHEHDLPDLEAKGPDGLPLIPIDAHIRLVSPHTHGGQRLLRRGYSFTDGIDPVTGELDAGLFFIAYQRDPRRQFVPIQAMLSEQDALNEYLRQTSSAIFAVPPGVQEAGAWGAALFA
jgi:deferrochelatase/peroxidase EfeB